MRPVTRTAVLVLAAAVALHGCGDDDDVDAGAGGTPQDAAFCDAWDAWFASGDDDALDELLAGAPPELEDAAAVVRSDPTAASPEGAAAGTEILDWVELNCGSGEAGDSQRHVAPPLDTALDGLRFCATTAFLSSPPDGRSGVVLYGEAGVDDPYEGPMLGVFWNPAGVDGHAGDGEAEPVTVRGQEGVAAPITVFQQVILPELGTVIAWTEGDRAVGLYGRQWPVERAGELVDIANDLEADEDGFRLPDEALPDGYGEVFAGDPSVASFVLPTGSLYSLRYESDSGLLDVNGLQMTEGEFEAFRFLTVDVRQGEVAGRDALIGNAWHDDGPAVVTWREPDGLVVRIVGLTVPLETAQEVASESRELTDDEWAALVEAEDQCAAGP